MQSVTFFARDDHTASLFALPPVLFFMVSRFFTATPPLVAARWAALALSLGALAWPYLSKKQQPLFTVGPDGVTLHRVGSLLIPWRCIAGVRLLHAESWSGRSFLDDWSIKIYLSDTGFLAESSLPRRQKRRAQKKRLYKLDLVSCTQTPQQVYEQCVPFIRQFCPAQPWQDLRVEPGVSFR